jgi:hypothetical protein
VKSDTNIPDNLFISHAEEVEEILQQAVRAALDTHKRLGHSIAAWQDGQVVIIPPEQIPVVEPLLKTKSPHSTR